MSVAISPPWTLDPEQAIQLQETLRSRLVLKWDEREVNTIGGVDVDYSGELTARAAIAVMHYPSLRPTETAKAEAPLLFPYIPGLLAFRIGPAILEAWEKVSRRPDVLLVHGHGIAHPRGFGLASHLGLWLEVPTIGVARSHLYGKQTDVGPMPGDSTELRNEYNSHRVIGAVLRTKKDTQPVYISPGHLIDLAHAIEIVMACCRDYRMPEPIRKAHEAAARVERSMTSSKPHQAFKEAT